jgi:DNA helicase-2/ATP-dependent DNA helicase PcrA
VYDPFAALTEAQRQAVEHIDGPLLILAGPGSGKTRVVTCRMAYLLQQGIPADQIVTLTFTNKAADEIRSRVAWLCPGQSVWASTFHRFCARLLRRYARLVGLESHFVIYDTEDSQRVLRRVLDDIAVDLHRATPGRVAAAISWAKNNLITPYRYEPHEGSLLGGVAAEAYPLYQARLLAANAVDFDDLLLHVVVLLQEHADIRQELDDRFRYILVDEYQDTNLAQYAIVRSLSTDYPNLAVTGDPDQSIYGWRGASLRNILEFEHDYPNVRIVRLEENYRSTKRILRVAEQLIEHNQLRKSKALFTANGEGRPVRFVHYANQQEEAEGIAARIADEVRWGRRRPREFAILYRVNALSRALEEALRLHGLRYQIVNGLEFYQRKEIKDVLAYLALLNNPRDDVAFERIVNCPARGIGRTTLDRLRAYASQHETALWEAAASFAGSLSSKAAAKLRAFTELCELLAQQIHRPLGELLREVVDRTGYAAQFKPAEGETLSEEDAQRLANIQELITAAQQFDEHHGGQATLEEFLEHARLVNDIDAWDDETDCVTLMTLHAAKGLEFPVVWIIGLEMGLIPHERSSQQAEKLEEERRLLFVGMTRAQQELHLTAARERKHQGTSRLTVLSPFLFELPREEMEWVPGAWQAPAEEPAPPPHESPPASEKGAAPRVVTADQLPGAPTAPRAQPAAADSSLAAARCDFCPGMVVLHPEYGPGKIVDLSGEGDDRRATVQFAGGAGEKSFIVSYSPLRPVR